MKRRRRRQYETEETVELGELLGTGEGQQWTDEAYQEQEDGQYPQEEHPEVVYLEENEDFFSEEYSEAHEAADSETRFHIAMGLFDLISIFVGIVVILVLVGMLVTLFNWLRTDILHSALLLQSGLQ